RKPSALSTSAGFNSKGLCTLAFEGTTALVGAMITLIQRRSTIKFTEPTWGQLLALAQQAGWCPSGAITIQFGTAAPDYGPGQLVFPSDARELAAALERVVNSNRGDGEDLDLASMVRVINFLRQGAFEIR